MCLLYSIKMAYVYILVAALMCLCVCPSYTAVPRRSLKTPVCTSHSTLCDVTFVIRTTDAMFGPQTYKTSDPICRCSGATRCPDLEDDPRRTVYQEMSSLGDLVVTKLSYCDERLTPNRKCKQNEVAVTLRGMGPIIFELVGDITCLCSQPLVLHSAKPDGLYSLREFACGKETCNVNRSDPPVCERVTSSLFGALQSEIPCLCPKGFECHVDGSRIPRFGRSAEFYCMPRAFPH